MQYRFAALLFCAAALTPLVASAQQGIKALSPTDSAALVPTIKYESAFTNYLPFRDEKLVPWREVNDEVGRVGGHLGIFGRAAGHDSTKSAVQTPTPTSKPAVLPAPQMMHGADHEGMKK